MMYSYVSALQPKAGPGPPTVAVAVLGSKFRCICGRSPVSSH